MIDTALASHTSVTDLLALTPKMLNLIREGLHSVLERQRSGE